MSYSEHVLKYYRHPSQSEELTEHIESTKKHILFEQEYIAWINEGLRSGRWEDITVSEKTKNDLGIEKLDRLFELTLKDCMRHLSEVRQELDRLREAQVFLAMEEQ